MSLQDKQIYDGYKPVVCELHPYVNVMCLLRNGSFIGLVQQNKSPTGKGDGHHIRMFDEDDVIINLANTSVLGVTLSLNDLSIIQDNWNAMQEKAK